MATDRITNRNLAREACSSRQAIFAAEAQVSDGFCVVATSGLPLHDVFDDHAVAKHDTAVGVCGNLCVVRYKDQGRSAGAVSFEQQVEDVNAVFRVEISGGLVGKDDGRLQDEGPGECHALLLATG